MFDICIHVFCFPCNNIRQNKSNINFGKIMKIINFHDAFFFVFYIFPFFFCSQHQKHIAVQ